jgi:hypothetical protein
LDSEENVDDFDMDAFINELDQFDCKGDHKSVQKFSNICDDSLESAVIAPVGEFRENGIDFYDFLNKNIYMPLAYKRKKRGTFTQNLLDLSNLDLNSTILNKATMNTNFNTLEKQVLKNFGKIQFNSDQPKQTHEKIAASMIEILKNFHVYWNSLRVNKEMDRVKIETQNLMRKIL